MSKQTPPPNSQVLTKSSKGMLVLKSQSQAKIGIRLPLAKSENFFYIKFGIKIM